MRGFARYAHCPACGSGPQAEILAELGQADWQDRMELVQCRDCDHIYYANPPGEDWFANFYRSEWNAPRGEKLSAAAEPDTAVKDTAARLMADAGLLNPSSRTLEIGCGTGGMMAGLEAAGLTDIHGTEASDYRAAKTALRFPGRVYNGGYTAVPGGLQFDFIYSHHVVEHIYDPHAALQWMAERLNPGGAIAITVPNARIEPVLNQLLFIPHLHSFCHRSLHKMAESSGFGTAFWKGINAPYEIAVLLFRPDRPPRLNAMFLTDGEMRELTAQESMQSRFQALAGENCRAETAHYLLHAGEKGALAMAKHQGLQKLTPGEARYIRLTTALGKRIAALGFRRAGNKKIGKKRALTVHCKPDTSAHPIVGSVQGDLALHIK